MWVITAFAGPNLTGVAPFCLHVDEDGARRLSFIGYGEAAPDHLDLVARQGERGAFADLVPAHLADVREEWDIFDVEGLAENSPLRSAIAGWNEVRGMWSREEVASCCPYATLPASYATYLESGRTFAFRRPAHRQRPTRYG